MHPSTLGSTPNPLLEKYSRAFLVKLQNLWMSQIGWELPPDIFLLSPDIQSLLLVSVRPGNHESHTHIWTVRAVYQKYQMHGWQIDPTEYIPGTDILLTLNFHNPDAHKSTHPDHQKDQITLGFGSQSAEDWRRLFARSFDIVRQVSPGCMDEISRVIRKIIPFWVSYRVHNSGSYSDAIGHLLMSYPTGVDDPELVLLEAILHEYNHNKLNLILQTEKLVLNDYRELYYSPYRPDARHLHGIFLGVHAITGAFWVIWHAHVTGVLTLSESWLEKSVLSVLKNGISLQVLDRHASLTLLGKEILEEIRSVHRECLGFIQRSAVPAEIIQRAKDTLVSHYEQVQKNYPNLQR